MLEAYDKKSVCFHTSQIEYFQDFQTVYFHLRDTTNFPRTILKRRTIWAHLSKVMLLFYSDRIFDASWAFFDAFDEVGNWQNFRGWRQ